MDYTKKTVIAFDLDGTLAVSKSQLGPDMNKALCRLLEQKHVAVASGGWFKQFESQFLSNLDCPEDLLSKLLLLPASGSEFRIYDTQSKAWTVQYSEQISEEDKRAVFEALEEMKKEFPDMLPKEDELFGPQEQDRGSQITFSVLGQQAPPELKYAWDPDVAKRRKLRDFLEPRIPKTLRVRTGGSTSIDINRVGIDKAYGMQKVLEYLGKEKDELVYIGDALYPNGNDYVVHEAGYDTVQTEGPQETMTIIEDILSIHMAT